MIGTAVKWYDDPCLVEALPLRYRAYAMYSHLVGEKKSRRVPGGSFVLRMLRDASALTGTSTIAPVRGIDGLTVMTDFADERVLEVIHEIRGENPEYAVMRELLGEGDTFVDVGANFGTFSLLASRLVGKSGKVIAIEPQERLVSLLRESIAASEVRNCEVVPAACGSARGRATLMVPVDDSGRAGLFSAFSGRRRHEKVDVQVTTLDALLAGIAGSGRMFMKIDVEGSELAVLEGAINIVRKFRPAMMIEINPWSAAAAGTTPKEIIARLMAVHYSSFAAAESFPAPLDPSQIPSNRQINLIARA